MKDFRTNADAAQKAKTSAERAQREAAPGYPKPATESLQQGRANGSPSARINRGKKAEADVVLTR